MARSVQRSQAALLTVAPSPSHAAPRQVAPEEYVDDVIDAVRSLLIIRFSQLAEAGTEVPDPDALADLLGATIPDPGPAELDPYFAGVGPFYGSSGARVQLRGITKQALDSRRRNQTILAMQTGGGHWLYPAWQFTGQGTIHDALVPVLRALRGMDRWAAAVWLVSEHPDLKGLTPRQALRELINPEAVARVAQHDKAMLAS